MAAASITNSVVITDDGNPYTERQVKDAEIQVFIIMSDIVENLTKSFEHLDSSNLPPRTSIKTSGRDKDESLEKFNTNIENIVRSVVTEHLYKNHLIVETSIIVCRTSMSDCTFIIILTCPHTSTNIYVMLNIDSKGVDEEDNDSKFENLHCGINQFNSKRVTIIGKRSSLECTACAKGEIPTTEKIYPRELGGASVVAINVCLIIKTIFSCKVGTNNYTILGNHLYLIPNSLGYTTEPEFITKANKPKSYLTKKVNTESTEPREGREIRLNANYLNLKKEFVCMSNIKETGTTHIASE